MTSSITDLEGDLIDFSATSVAPSEPSLVFNSDKSAWSITVSQSIVGSDVNVTFIARDPHFINGDTTETVVTQQITFNANRPPRLNSTIANQTAYAGNVYTYAITGAIFIEDDGEPLTLTHS